MAEAAGRWSLGIWGNFLGWIHLEHCESWKNTHRFPNSWLIYVGKPMQPTRFSYFPEKELGSVGWFCCHLSFKKGREMSWPVIDAFRLMWKLLGGDALKNLEIEHVAGISNDLFNRKDFRLLCQFTRGSVSRFYSGFERWDWVKSFLIEVLIIGSGVKKPDPSGFFFAVVK